MPLMSHFVLNVIQVGPGINSQGQAKWQLFTPHDQSFMSSYQVPWPQKIGGQIWEQIIMEWLSSNEIQVKLLTPLGFHSFMETKREGKVWRHCTVSRMRCCMLSCEQLCREHLFACSSFRVWNKNNWVLYKLRLGLVVMERIHLHKR